MREQTLKSIVFNCIRFTSAITAVALTALWVRSYFVLDTLGLYAFRHDLLIASVYGTIQLTVDNTHTLDGLAWDQVYFGFEHMRTLFAPSLPLYGFGFTIRQPVHQVQAGYRGLLIIVPNWFALLLCLVGPARWWRRHHVAKKRQRLQMCITCGYDLRDIKDRCPECGTPV